MSDKPYEYKAVPVHDKFSIRMRDGREVDIVGPEQSVKEIIIELNYLAENATAANKLSAVYKDASEAAYMANAHLKASLVQWEKLKDILCFIMKGQH